MDFCIFNKVLFEFDVMNWLVLLVLVLLFLNDILIKKYNLKIILNFKLFE